MKITETNIPNQFEDNLNYSKIILANKTIKLVKPLFENFFNKKNNKIEIMKNQLKEKQIEINDVKETLEKQMNEYSLLKKQKKLIERINNLIISKTIKKNMIHEYKIILKIIPKLSESELDKQIKRINIFISEEVI
jgi:hypothetical protein